jgi:hypothetical protein
MSINSKINLRKLCFHGNASRFWNGQIANAAYWHFDLNNIQAFILLQAAIRKNTADLLIPSAKFI